MNRLFFSLLLFTSFSTQAQLDTSNNLKSFLPKRMTVAQLAALSASENEPVLMCVDTRVRQIKKEPAKVEPEKIETEKIESVKAEPVKIEPVKAEPVKKKADYIKSDIAGITICDQLWMTKNLNVAKYRNGDPIPMVSDPDQWARLSTGAYCYYNNDSAKYAAVYGKLYNWYAVNDPRGLAPPGWHIPNIDEWVSLETCLTSAAGVGSALKESGTANWSSPNSGATDMSGFSGLPGGFRDFNGTFYFIKNYGYWWSSSDYYSNFAWGRNLYYFGVLFGRDGYKMQNAFSVRCVRD